MRGPLVAAGTAGLATMALELLAVRRLAPTFGGTLTTWAWLIAATLLSGACGAMLGARWARPATLARVGTALVYAVLATVLVLVAGGPVIGVCARLPSDLGVGLASLFLVGPAVVALAALPPLCVALGTASGLPAGVVAGRVLCVSTLGSLVGTLGTALVFVPALGVQRSTAAVAILCAIVAACLVRRRGGAIGATLVLVAAGWFATREPPRSDLVLARPSAHGDVEVVLRDGAYVLLVDGVPQGTRGPFDGGLTALRSQGQASAAIPLLHPAARQALVVGLGAGRLTEGLCLAGLTVTAIDVHPGVVEVVRERWGLPGRVVVGDGRAAWGGLAGPFDAVVLDAFAAETLPWHLLTVEAMREVKARCAQGALIVVHLVGRAGHRVTGAVAATLRAVFAQGLAVRSVRGDGLEDLFLFASDVRLAWPPHPELATCERFTPPPGPVLTDDESPLDRWNEPLARALRRATR